MKVLIAPDSFKGSLSAVEICNLFLSEIKTLNISTIPLADGGEGSLQAIKSVTDFEKISLSVSNPLLKDITAYYLIDKKNKTAYIEMALASGLNLLDNPNVMNASSYGTGELMADALHRGMKNIVLFVGGSATNDAGIGVASALNVFFYDRSDELVRPMAKNLTRILKIDRSHSLLSKYNAKIKIAVDVNNPFYGKNGAAYTYAAQKGANYSQIIFLDKALKHIADIFHWKYGIDVQKIKGAGAAGGLAGGLAAIFNAEIIPATDIIFSLTNLEYKIREAEIIVSGEGKIDKQTLNGKLLLKVSKLVRKYNKRLWAICGYFDGKENLQKQLNIEKIFSLAQNKEEVYTKIEKAKPLMMSLASDLEKALKNL